MKKILALILALCLIFSLCALAGCGETTEAEPETTTEEAGENVEEAAAGPDVGESFDIVYAAVTTSLAPYVIAISNNMQAMCDNNGWNLTQYDGEGNVTVQTEQIANIIADGEADAVVCFPVDSEVGVTYAEQMHDAGIPFFTLSNDVAEAGKQYVTAFISLDLYGDACKTATYAYETLGADAGLKYVVLSGWESQADYALRETGVRDTFDANTNYEYLTTQYCGASRADAMDYASQLITAYGDDLGLFMCLSDEFAHGALQAIREAGREDIKIASIECFQETVPEIESGAVLSSVTQLSTRLIDVLETTLKAWLAGEELEYTQYCVQDVVTIDNVAEIAPLLEY